MKLNQVLFPLVFICLLLSSCTYTRYSTRFYKRAEKAAPYDVIIVPGVPYGDSSVSIILKARILWAKYLYDHNIAKNIIFSGSAVYSPYVEGKIMRIYADSIGIPHAHTYSETKAEHSVENVYYSWQMAKKLGFQKIAVATDPFQTKMLRRFFKKRAKSIDRIPIIFETLKTRDQPWPVINPASAHVDNFTSIVVRLTKWQRYRATMGKNIDFKSEKDLN